MAANTYKQAIVVRTDLNLSSGKAAAQASHASLYAADRADPTVREVWMENSTTKIVLGAASEQELRRIFEEAGSDGLPRSLVSDEGRTEIDSGTTTALAVGPAPVEEVDGVTGSLPLY